MASLTTTATVIEPEISRVGLPDYGTRLRRARLGLLVALIPVLMLFVSFTSAYVVRQGLPSLDPRTNNLIRDWIPLALPRLLLLNTFVLLVSSVSMELARRQIRARARGHTDLPLGRCRWLVGLAMSSARHGASPTDTSGMRALSAARGVSLQPSG